MLPSPQLKAGMGKFPRTRLWRSFWRTIWRASADHGRTFRITVAIGARSRDGEDRMKSPWRLLWSAFWAPIRGRLGEAAVNAGAVLTLPSSVYRRYHNVMLRTSGTTQIDHVLVSVLGYSWWKRRTWRLAGRLRSTMCSCRCWGIRGGNEEHGRVDLRE